MRAAVTGGAGFIGSNLVDALVARGDDVTVVDNFASGKRENLNPDATLVEHDIRGPLALEADVIFHLAAQADVQTSMKRPEYDAAVNVVGTVNVLASAPSAQVIFASSGGAGYGECAEPANEDAPFLPLSPYGIAKNAARSTSRAGTASTGRRTCRCASRTSTGRVRTPASKAASSRSSSSGSCATSRR